MTSTTYTLWVLLTGSTDPFPHTVRGVERTRTALQTLQQESRLYDDFGNVIVDYQGRIASVECEPPFCG